MPKDGKKSDRSPMVLWVVAGALAGRDSQWLMHQRPLNKHHGGLWEFPGGKVETAEKPVESLIRELREELGIVVEADDCAPITFAEERGQEGADQGKRAIVILLYKITAWSGKLASLEGGQVEWFSPQEVLALDKPPLDEQLAAHLFDGAV